MRNPQNIKLEDFKDKSTLVKLLIEEDVTVTYQKVSTNLVLILILEK